MEAALFLVTGFEDVEAIATADILRRGGAGVALVSLSGEKMVKSSHDIWIQADMDFSQFLENCQDVKILILPGGPGTGLYLQYPRFLALLEEFNNLGKYIAAICAAPTVLSHLAITKGKKAVCYPSHEKDMQDTVLVNQNVVVDGNIITSRGPATAMDFGLRILEVLKGRDVMESVSDGVLAEFGIIM